MDAINDVSPKLMLNYLKTTLTTNFLKFPFFEAINAFCAALPLNPSIRGIFTGFVFTTATLPVTNFRYRKSMELPVNWSNIYEAYFPTVIRDIVYGIVRNYCTLWTLALAPSWKAADPQVLFIVVILGCFGSAPFNEWRGFLLQSKGQDLTFKEFFNLSNCARSSRDWRWLWGTGARRRQPSLSTGCSMPFAASRAAPHESAALLRAVTAHMPRWPSMIVLRLAGSVRYRALGSVGFLASASW